MSLESLLHLLELPSEQEVSRAEPGQDEINDIKCGSVKRSAERSAANNKSDGAMIADNFSIKRNSARLKIKRKNSKFCLVCTEALTKTVSIPDGSDLLQIICSTLAFNSIMPSLTERNLSVGNSHFCEDCTNTIIVSRNVMNQIKILEKNLDQLRDQLKKSIKSCIQLPTNAVDARNEESAAVSLVRKLFAQSVGDSSAVDAVTSDSENFPEKESPGGQYLPAKLTIRFLRRRRQTAESPDLEAENYFEDKEGSADERNSMIDTDFFDPKELLTISEEEQSKSDESEEFVMQKRKRRVKEKAINVKSNSESKISRKKKAAKKPFVCSECGKGYISQDIYEAHLKVHSGELEYACQHCDKKFALLKYLQLHNRTAHNITNKLQSETTHCPFCGLDFLHEDNLTSNEKFDGGNTTTHSENPENEAQRIKSDSSSSKDFSNPDQSTASIAASLTPNLTPKFLTWSEEKKRRNHMSACPENPRVKYKDHQSTATKIPCNQCDKTFCTVPGLNSHIANIHLKRFKLYCEICGAGFQLPCDLKRHREGVHTDEKKYECDICHLRFKRSHQLLYHRRNHTGNLPFVCETCGKAFSAPEKLKRHSEIHTDVNRFPCHICGKLFKSTHYVYNHVYTTHYGNKRGRHPTATSENKIISSFSGNLTTHSQPTYHLHDQDV